MRPFVELARYAAPHPILGPPDPAEGGFFLLPSLPEPLVIIASWCDGWDHVSVSLPNRCPSWSEMEHAKRTFFRDDETAMQLHVPPVDHVSLHPFCLHLWRPQSGGIPRPPKHLIL